jgi:hypothetical protein
MDGALPADPRDAAVNSQARGTDLRSVCRTVGCLFRIENEPGSVKRKQSRPKLPEGFLMEDQRIPSISARRFELLHRTAILDLVWLA